MNIRNTVTTCVNYVKANKWDIAAKAAGVAAAGYVLNNANYAGKQDSAINVRKRQAKRLTKSFYRSRRLEDRNVIASKLKDAVFRTDCEWNLPDKFNAVTGYLGGFFNQFAVDVVPAALATGALLSKKYGKYFGLGLAAWALKFLVVDVLDVGRPTYIK